MLWTIAVILAVLWLLGMAKARTPWAASSISCCSSPWRPS